MALDWIIYNYRNLTIKLEIKDVIKSIDNPYHCHKLLAEIQDEFHRLKEKIIPLK